eukprot:CAMPEP_0197320696 /NCGR_PEP_ID=MMETSP0891-20130614/61167_1 /TAXON_ID=44058 ORGANISM="Aureoumbra lagunensis, Strain CCMP1510" /NCGR_SAMPLE_ID=MMETSP0891 /ASSEMBLY_ACC=CAM_ASM_000534 /LENGTH=1335 /DNA_ID=CAMNT_0042812211 /DNA_START=134 /DNA_END=4141 /DNA_ORIENTATION=-
MDNENTITIGALSGDELELTAKFRASVLADEPLSTVLRDFGKDNLSIALKAIVPDETAIRRIISAASGSSTNLIATLPSHTEKEVEAFENSLPLLEKKSLVADNLDNCVDLMIKGKYLDAYDALEGLFGNSEHVLHRCSILLRGICAAELGGGADLDALLKAPQQIQEEAPIRDIVQARIELDRSDPRQAYAAALCAASRPRMTPKLTELAKQYLARADALIVEEDSTKEQTMDNKEDYTEEDDDDEYSIRAGKSAALKKLNKMVGLTELKEDWLELKESVELDQERDEDPRNKQYSILLAGKTGTGKTVLGKLYAQLIEELNIVPTSEPPRFVDTTGSKLVQMGPQEFVKNVLNIFGDDGRSKLDIGDSVIVANKRHKGVGTICYVDSKHGSFDVHFGDSVEIKVRRAGLIALDRLGGILFIDDAWQLEPQKSTTGRQIIDLLQGAMDDFGGRLVVILAGQEDKLDNLVFNDPYAPGLSSRFRKRYVLPDFNDDELEALMYRILENKKPKFTLSENRYARIAAKRLGKQRSSTGFANARAVENLIDTIGQRQTARVLKARRQDKDIDIFAFTRDDILGSRQNLRAKIEASSAWKKLHEMYGLERVKQSVSQLITMAETNAEREELELPLQSSSLNRVFYGNPGTGKTTVAKLYGEILRELGLLSDGELVVTNPSDFVGSALGQSEEKTVAILEKAKGKVLVIDEAYGLHPSPGGNRGQLGDRSDPYKSAVIDTIVARVQGVAGEDQCVLLLGYKREMQDLVQNANPGLARRFQLDHAFEFEDYDDDALFRILLSKVKLRGRTVTFEAARTAVRKKLAKERLRPNFGNAGAIDNLVSDAVSRAEQRIQRKHSGCANTRAQDLALLEEDFYVEPPHFANPEQFIFNGLIGCNAVREKLREYQSVVNAARAVGRDPIADLPLTFVFSGEPGTGKTTIAKRMGMLFEALGVLPSSDVHVCSASDFSTGYVGQAARKTREYFESARGAVLFIDEAYRLYDPHGRSYFQEATDEIVSMLTEDEFQGKMVVIFAGYPAQMRAMLDNVNPGLKSRLTEIINFPNFDVAATAELAELQLTSHKRIDVLHDLKPYAQRLIDAPQWANGRDVETWVKRIASEAAKAGHPTQATADVISRATDYLLQLKAPLEDDTKLTPIIINDDLPMATLDPHPLPIVDVQVVQEIAKEEEEDGPVPPGSDDLRALLEQACVICGYDENTQKRTALRDALSSGQIPEDILTFVRAKENSMTHDQLYAALMAQAPSVANALSSKILYDSRRAMRLAKLSDEDRQNEIDREHAVLTQLKQMGKCPAGFNWHREGAGWRCGGGSHFVSDDDPLLADL